LDRWRIKISLSTKVELNLNLQNVKALGIEIPPLLLAQADDVIELRPREFVSLLGGAGYARPLAGSPRMQICREGWLPIRFAHGSQSSPSRALS
jgi:hypothetical protein